MKNDFALTIIYTIATLGTITIALSPVQEENIKNISNDKFLYYRNDCLYQQQIAMCYNVALPHVWGNIFNISS